MVPVAVRRGVVTGADGRKVHGKQAFFVLTTNAGSEGAGGNSVEAHREAVLPMRNHFRPELLNRREGVVVLRDLQPVDLERILELHLGQLRARGRTAASSSRGSRVA